MKLYQDRWQIGSGTASDDENRLADALEAAFTAGHHDLDALIAALNRAGVRAPGGAAWTADSFKSEMKRLGA